MSVCLYSFLTKNNLTSSKQFGFRSGHSTEHALISLIETVKSSIDKFFFVYGDFLDLQKSF